MKSKVIHNILNRTVLKSLLARSRFLVRWYFNSLYRANDPYQQRRQVEREKFERAFGLVRNFRASRSLEIGCGEGRWTHFLAAFSDRVLACDISDRALDRARQLHRGHTNIEYIRKDLLRDDFSGKTFDFILCSEVLYYFTRSQLQKVVPKIVGWLNPGGKLLLIHIRSLKDDSSGQQLKEFGALTIHREFLDRPELQLEEDIIEPGYRISLWRRREGSTELEGARRDISPGAETPRDQQGMDS